MTKPVIGITLDSEPAGGYAASPWYAVRENYCDTVSASGGVPLLLPHEPDVAERYLEMIDGLIITGGAFDIDPAKFGATERHAEVTTKEKRTAFEWAVTKGAMDRDMPMLGICGGEQLLNVVLGGTLVQHIPDEVANALEHEQKNPKTEPGHAVTVTPGTLLHRIAGTEALSVNTTHHQSVKALGKDMTVNATAPDGVIEGIECGRFRFCLGVQWHPEYGVDPADTKIFAALIDASP